MENKVKCWEIFKCKKEECPVYKLKELKCWLISGTHCRDDIQGKFLEKMEMCLECKPFVVNMDVSAMRETIEIVNKQFKEFRIIVGSRDKELEDISMELALGLSEVLEGLNKIASGNPRVRISEVSENELISKLEQVVNKTAKEIGTIVDQSHEFAIGLAEHFDVLNRVSKGELSARITEDSQDELLRALGRVTNHMIESVSTEITERKRAEEELREKVEREDLILRSLPMAFYNAQDFGNFFGWVWVSEQIDRISGFPANKFTEDHYLWVSRIHLDNRERVLKEFETIYKQGTIATEYRWQCADGEYRWFRDQAVLIKDEQGNPKEVIGTWRDITDRKQSEEALRISEEKFRTIIETTTDWIWEIDKEGRHIFCNPAAETILGYSLDEIVGKDSFQFMHEEDRLLFKKKLSELIANKSGWSGLVIRWQHKDGSYRYLESTAVPIYNADGELVGYRGCRHDITERMRIEAEIRRLNEELEQRVLQRTAQLETANRELESFSYSVSHDLRAPLRAIDGFSKILSEDYVDKLDDEGKRLLNIIRSNTKKMGQLIDDLLALSRIGRKEIELSKIDMDKLAKVVFDEIKVTVPEREIQFDIKPLPPAHGDPLLVHQVFFNLLSNAVKFTRLKETAVIEVGGYAEGLENVYYVKDNGVGFNMQYKDKLFGAFQRLHSEEEFEGTGIGLAVVKRIVNRHGGEIWAEGKANEGSTFYFKLPSEAVCFSTKS